MKRRNVNGRFGIVLEPTELKVLTAHRVDIRFDVTVFGKAAHSSRPDKGINSIIKAMKIVEVVKDYNNRIRIITIELQVRNMICLASVFAVLQ